VCLAIAVLAPGGTAAAAVDFADAAHRRRHYGYVQTTFTF
jgi:hypothetical protein